MQCPRCQQENPPPVKFCPECGAPVVGAGTVAASVLSSYADLKDEIESLRHALAEAFEKQTATSEILRVISSSPTGVQRVFDVIVSSATRLCDGLFAAMFRFDGEQLHFEAHHNFTAAQYEHVRVRYPQPPAYGSAVGRAVLDRTVVHVPETRDNPDFPVLSAAARGTGARAYLAVPMLREGAVLGVIGVARSEPRPFSPTQVDLVKTFADQAVIAIENVRLFNELQGKNQALTQAHAQVSEALAQQTATADILRVISRSPTDVQPVFDTIVRSARALTDAHACGVFLLHGDIVSIAAHDSLTDEWRQEYPRVASANTVSGRAMLQRTTVHVSDLSTNPDYEGAPGRRVGIRTVLAAPMFREEQTIGAIVVWRTEVRPFSDKQIALLQTFVDQAVIAIENTRLFKELQVSNRELTDALEQQTATSEILRVISSSPTDVQPVFQAIIENAVQLCGAVLGRVFRRDNNKISLAAHQNFPDEAGDFPRPLDDETLGSRAARTGQVIRSVDVDTDPRIPAIGLAAFRARRVRSVLVVPISNQGETLGSIVVGHADIGAFSDVHVAMLQTFADQAVIAIENVRLFGELQEKNRALTEAHAQVTEALDQQTATSQILRVIARSPTNLQPVFDELVENAGRLCQATEAALLLVEGDQLTVVATSGYVETTAIGLSHPIHRGWVAGRAVTDARTVHVEDLANADADFPLGREIAIRFGHRTALATPLVREGTAIGVFFLRRRQVRRFSDKEIALLQTFADQAVIAIENVRLFDELQARTADLTRSVDRLTALSEVGRAISSTLDLDTVLQTIVSRAVHLTGTDGGSIYEYDAVAEEFSIRATRTAAEEVVEAQRFLRLRRGEGVVGQLANTKQAVQVPDITAEGAYSSRMRDTLIRAGVHSLLAVPLLRDDELIGALVVTRRQAGVFAAETIDLLSTFATQSALAIQNARLFHEIQVKSRQLEAASQHKSEFLANMSHELRTPLNAVIGFSEVLTERMFGELNEKQDEYLRDIYASGQHLLSLINDILDLSKIEAGRMELELADFHLPQAIGNALVLVRERALRRGIMLDQAIDSRLGDIRGDERKIKQVLLNLLSNAIKFTPDGGRINVRAMPRDAIVEISVSDTGVGIAPEDQEAIFEEFRQVGTAAKRVEGTGLGLTLSRKFIELHGGRIWVESELGTGSTFMFTIPMRQER